MTRLRTAVACCFLLAFMALPVSGAQADANSTMFAKINKVRAKHGLRKLRSAPSLSQSAGSYARTMMSRDYFGHQSKINAPGRFRRLGEAIAYAPGKRSRPRRTVRRWLHSPGHRALLLSSSFRYMGAGVSKGRFRGRGATIWVLHLGAR